MSFRQDVHPYDLLSPYLDGELEEEARVAIEVHLAGCSSCRVLVEDFQSMAASATVEAPPPVPDNLRGRIGRALDATRAPGGAVPGGWIWSYRLGLAAAAGIVLVIGLWALRLEPPPPVGTQAPAPVASETEGDLERPGAGTGAAPRPVVRVRPETAMERVHSLGDTGDDSRKKSEPASPLPLAHLRLSDGALPLREAPTPPTVSATPKATSPTPPGHEGKDLTAPSRKWAAPAQVAPEPASGGSRSDASTVEPGIARMQAATTAAGAPLSEHEAPSGRSLLVEFPAYRVSVFEDGTIALSAKGYSCAARVDESSVNSDLASLFTLASSSGEGVSGTPGPARPGAPIVRLVGPSATAGGVAGATGGAMVPAPKAIEIETRLTALLRKTYLSLMEERCGPAPSAVRTP